MSETNSRLGDFEPITDPLEIIKYFDESAKIKADVLIWTKNNEINAKCNVLSLSQAEKMIYTSPFNGEDPEKLYRALIAAGDRCFLNVKLERAALFFVSKLCSTSLAQLQFSLPQKLYKLQRRRNQRYKILDGHVFRIFFKNTNQLPEVIKQKAFDISSGGVSFIIDSQEVSLYTIGTILKDIAFTINTIEITVSGEILYCKPLPPDPSEPNREKIKIGVKFLDIDSSDAKTIEEYVSEQNRRFFSRFI